MNKQTQEKARRSIAARLVILIGFLMYAVVLFSCAAALRTYRSPAIFLSAQTAAPARETPAPDAHALEINSASAEALQQLPGIGPSLAQAIVDYRASQPFYFKEDLMNVPGIGQKRYQAVADQIRVAQPSFTVSPTCSPAASPAPETLPAWH